MECMGDDAAAVARVRAGDPEAFRELVERHSTRLFRLAYRLTRDEETAEDVVQEAFLKAYRRLSGFDARSSFATWLHRIATNCALDVLRRRKREAERLGRPEALGDGPEPAASDPRPDRLAHNREVEVRLRRALALLSPMERTAFELRHFEHRSIAEIGQVLGARTNATKQAVFRAVRKLRRELEPLMEVQHATTD